MQGVAGEFESVERFNSIPPTRRFRAGTELRATR